MVVIRLPKRVSSRGTLFVVRLLRSEPCVYCGELHRGTQGKMKGKIHATLDHIHPKSQGGSNTWRNVAPTCERCNSIKGSNSVLGFMLGEDIPSEHADLQEELPERWFDPLGELIGEPLTVGRG